MRGKSSSLSYKGGKSLSVFRKLTSVLLAFLFIISPLVPRIAVAENSAPANIDSNIADASLSDSVTLSLSKGDNSNSNNEEAIVDLAAPEKGNPDSAKTKDKTKPDDTAQAMSASSLSGDVVSDSAKIQDKARLPQSEAMTGALTYEYPIAVPPGRNGLQPDLKLSYNSQSGDEGSFVGYGWSLNIPYIERINRKGTDKLYSENYFNSSLSGELINISGTSYGAKIESGEFLKYELSSNSWLVTDKQGTKYKFGYSSATRQDNPSDFTKVFKWMLEEIRDTNDNFIRYEYFKDQGQIYPSRIIYTGNGAIDGGFEVNFLRADKDDLLSYKTGFSVRTAYKIYEINTKINGVWAKKYTLTYGGSDNNRRSLLRSVTESGQDELNNITALPVTSFNYQRATSSNSGWTQNTAWQIPVELGNERGYGHLADVNGDGLVDVLSAYDLGGIISNVYLNNGNGWVKDATWQVPVALEYAQILDVNGDGLADILYNGIYLNNGHGWTLSSVWHLPPVSFYYGFRAADVNGDGLIDFVQSWAGNQTKNVYLNNGAGWTQNLTWQIPMSFEQDQFSQDVQVVDINGDGLADILGNANSPGGIYINNGNNWVQSPDWHMTSRISQMADIDGDGLVDIIGATPYDGNTKVLLNNDYGGWIENYYWSSQISTSLRITQVLDVNGDGFSDLLSSYTDSGSGLVNNKVYLNNVSTKNDLANQINYPQGGRTDIVYKTTAQYKNGSTLLNPNLPFVLDTVQQIITGDGAGLNSTATYSYEGGKSYYADAYNRKFSGFSKVAETDATGNLTNTYFHQGDSTNSSQGEYSDHVSKIGKSYRTEAYNSTSNLYSKTISKWENYDMGSSRNFLKLTQKIDSNYDGNSTHRDKAETYTYDNANGNITEKIQWGEVIGTDSGTFTDTGTDKLSTTISYASNLTTNVIGLPSQETTLDQNSNKIKESKYYYDTLALGSVDKGNQTKEEKWKTGTDYINAQKSYNSYGLVTQDTDPRGKITTYTYDSYNLYPATVTNALSQATQYTYDYSVGKVKQTTDPNSYVFQTVFDGLDRVLEEKQPDLTTPSTLVTKFSYVYTDTVNAVSVKKTDYLDATISVDSYSYFDGLGRVIQTRQEAEDTNNFSVKDFVYNNKGMLNKESLPYFGSGFSRTTPSAVEGLYSAYAYDTLGRIISTANAVGTVTNTYDDWKVTTTDAKGVAKDLYKDAYGNLVQVGEHGSIPSDSGLTTSYTYDGAGDLIKITDALGNIRNFTYDGLGQRLTAEDLHAVVDATFGTWTYTYDASGNLTSQLDPKNQTVNYTYDDLNRQLTEDYTGQAGTEKTYTYDTCTNGVGRLCNVTLSSVEGSSSETKEYNALGAASKETKTINSINYITQYDYDRQGNNILLTNPDSSQVKNIYNSAGQLEQTQRKETTDADFINVVTDFDYSPLEKITYQADANDSATTNTYDAAKLYRLTSKVTMISGGSHAQDLAYTYDANGNITRIVDNSATNSKKTVDYTYDSLNRLLSATATGAINGQNYSETYAYDAIGNITSKNGTAYTYSQTGYANPHAVTSIGSTNYTYDDNGNLLTDGTLTNTWNYQNQLIQSSISTGQTVSATSTFPRTAGDGFIYKTSSSWAAAHDATSGNSANYTNTTAYVRTGKSGTTTYRIDRAFLPFNTSALPDNATITGAKLKVYVASKLNNDNDGTDWVTVVKATEASTASLVSADYDNAGSIANPIEGISSTERKDITNVATGQYLTFNLNTTGKNWISKTSSTKLALREGHDAINSAFVGSYGQYNSLNIRTGEYSGTSYDPVLEITYTVPAPTAVISYAYDAGGNRIKKTTGAGATTYVNNSYEISPTGKITKYISANSDTVATLETLNGTTTTYYNHKDHLGGSSVITDQAGVVSEVLDYLPYGSTRLDEKSGSFETSKKYTGKELDEETGLYYYGARYYNASTGRFVSLDPAFLAVGDNNKIKAITKQELQSYLLDPQGFNSYAYARNNPLQYTDPTGEFFGAFGTYVSNSQRNIAQGFYNLAGYLNNQGTADKVLGMASNIAGDVVNNIANITDPRQSTSTRLFSIGMVGLDVGSGGKGSGAGRVITKINPSGIRFTQDSISRVFGNGNTLESTINGLKSGKISPNDFPPIRIFEQAGKIFSLDNRRLHIFKEAGVKIPTIKATAQEIKNELVRKFTTFNEGKTINLR